MIIAIIKKEKNNQFFNYISVFSINKYFKLYNFDLNKILNYYIQKENELKLLNKETKQNFSGNEFHKKKVGKDECLILKFPSILNIEKYIKSMTNKKILSKMYNIYEINAYIINEINILMNAVSLNKSYYLNLEEFVYNKDKWSNIDNLIYKKVKIYNTAHNNNNNYYNQNVFLIYLIKYIYFYINTKNKFVIQNTEDFTLKSSIKKYTKVENNNYMLSGKYNNKLFQIEKSEFKIYGTNIIFPELIKIKPKGVMNKNGCCYLNAAIQCFYHCPKITSFFILNREIILKKGGPISKGYLEVVEEFSKNKNDYISINNFRKLLIETDESFNGNNGNDSKDVILLLLYSIQNELGGEEPDINLNIDITKEHLLFEDLIKSNKSINSIIMENFSFCEKKINKCFVCGEEYFTLSNQYFMLFNLKKIYNHYKKQNNEAISIEECLTYNCFEEVDLQIKCQKCNKLQNALTTISFGTVPYYLFIILYRGKNEEFDCKFDIKEEIDLFDLYNNIKGEKRENNLKYSLLAGTILHGEHGSGHTFAFAKHFDGNLYIFNDTNYRKTTFKEIKNKKVYLLFYQRLSNIND